MIYFLQSTEGGPIKIGFTDNLEARHKQLETHYGRPLVLLHVMEGGRNEERAVHDRFDHLRIEGVGRGKRIEQFRPAPELLAFIGRPLFVGANPDTIEAMPICGNIPVQIRLTDHDKVKIESVRERFGLPSMAAAIRYAVEYTHARTGPEKKSGKSKSWS